MKTFASWIRKALTHIEYRKRGRGKKLERIELPPSEKLVLGLQFCFVALGLLTALEITHIIVTKTFNEAIFASITGLIGTITGVFLTAK